VQISKYVKTEHRHVCKVIDAQDWPEDEKRDIKRKVLFVLKRDGRINYNAFEQGFRWNLCSEKLKSGDYTNWDGWEFRSNWAMTFRWGTEIQSPIPKWDGLPCDHIVILGEQGIGDEILFMSALPDLMVRVGTKCLEFQTYPRLRSIIERSFKIKTTDRRLLSHVTEGKALVALGDLFPWYRRDKSHFPRKPFLKADPEKVEYWKNWLTQFGDEKKIGLAWYTRKGYVEPESLMTDKGVYFDLQYRDSEKDIGKVPESVHQVPFDVTDDFENLFAFVKALDAVHTVTQTLCHVAGSQGTRCKAVIPPNNGEVKFFLWNYGDPNPVCESPIYANQTIYRGIDEFRKQY
jgi:hypothetical protein